MEISDKKVNQVDTSHTGGTAQPRATLVYLIYGRSGRKLLCHVVKTSRVLYNQYTVLYTV